MDDDVDPRRVQTSCRDRKWGRRGSLFRLLRKHRRWNFGTLQDWTSYFGHFGCKKIRQILRREGHQPYDGVFRRWAKNVLRNGHRWRHEQRPSQFPRPSSWKNWRTWRQWRRQRIHPENSRFVLTTIQSFDLSCFSIIRNFVAFIYIHLHCKVFIEVQSSYSSLNLNEIVVTLV